MWDNSKRDLFFAESALILVVFLTIRVIIHPSKIEEPQTMLETIQKVTSAKRTCHQMLVQLYISK